MPELPEVESVRRGLELHVVGNKIIDVSQLHPRAINPKSIARLDYVNGSSITTVRRRGKFLWFELDTPLVLVAHLGMSGQFLVDAPNHPHTRALLHLRKRNVNTTLAFNDQRTFGWLSVNEMKNGYPTLISKIAKDPFDPEFDMKSVVKNIKARSTTIKKAILDQHIISGVGNIYADEALWKAKIHPDRICIELTSPEITRVISSATSIMKKAIEVGGTSFDQLYVNVNGESGTYSNSLKAYGQEGEECPRCATLIIRTKFTYRSSHICPKCQQMQPAFVNLANISTFRHN
jgi:formamidopyrimidine-DNA glycosylase